MHWISRPELQTPGCVTLWWGVEFFLSGKRSSIWEVGDPLGVPLVLQPNEENTNKFQCWGAGEGWLPKPWRDAQVHKTRTGLPTPKAAGGWLKEKIQQHQSHSRTQHHGEGLGKGRNQSKAKSVLPWAPLAPQEFGLALGSWASLCRAHRGVGSRGGQGTCGWVRGRSGHRQRLRKGATRTTPSWK